MTNRFDDNRVLDVEQNRLTTPDLLINVLFIPGNKKINKIKIGYLRPYRVSFK